MVLGHVQTMGAEGIRMPDKLLRGFRAMMVVLRSHPPSRQTVLYYLRAVLNAAIGYQGMDLPYWSGQLEEVESKVRSLIRGYDTQGDATVRVAIANDIFWRGYAFNGGGV